MKTILLSFILVIFASCGKKSDLVTFSVSEEDFSQYINKKSAPNDPNLQQDVAIINNEYPFEIALYQDGKWYYDLPNLDTGFGTWSYSEGKIKLYARRKLFDMHIDLTATSEAAKDIVIQFSDRFGPQVLEMKKNIE